VWSNGICCIGFPITARVRFFQDTFRWPFHRKGRSKFAWFFLVIPHFLPLILPSWPLCDYDEPTFLWSLSHLRVPTPGSIRGYSRVCHRRRGCALTRRGVSRRTDVSDMSALTERWRLRLKSTKTSYPRLITSLPDIFRVILEQLQPSAIDWSCFTGLLLLMSSWCSVMTSRREHSI
jgi:hypothetical protein